MPAPGGKATPHGKRRRSPRASDREHYKRTFDLAAIAAALLLLFPLWVVLCVAVPVAIRLESPGPVLYRQARLGRGGRVFRILKFRTMIDGAERRTGPIRAAWRDARTTRVGRVLRRLHLDELPQIVNVLRGEMSLVGPRPERPELTRRIERTVPAFPARLQVRPGITGLAQVFGQYHWHPRRKLLYDRLYIARMSPWLDLWLCLLSVRKVLRNAPARPGPDRRSSSAWNADAGPERAHRRDGGKGADRAMSRRRTGRAADRHSANRAAVRTSRTRDRSPEELLLRAVRRGLMLVLLPRTM